jgi:hypothetical protein
MEARTQLFDFLLSQVDYTVLVVTVTDCAHLIVYTVYPRYYKSQVLLLQMHLTFGRLCRCGR